MFSIYGDDTQWADMYTVLAQLKDFLDNTCHTIKRQGRYLIDESEDPVRERVVLNVGASFGGVL